MTTKCRTMASVWMRMSMICLVLLLTFACIGMQAKAAQSADIASAYTLGSEIRIPEVSFTLDQQSVTAAAMVKTPSGIVYRVDEVFVPTENGIHTLSYVAYDSQGNRQSEEYTFTVVAPLYAVGNARSSVKLGKYAYGDYTIDRTAILASVSSTDKFSYSKIIDLKALNGESFLEFFVTPENIGTCDVAKINVVLTDLYDAENFITISIKRGTGSSGAAWLERTSYITANAPSQPPTGLEMNKGDLEIDGTMYQLHKNNVWGAGVPFAPAGNPGYVSLEEPNPLPQNVGSQTMALAMDCQTNAIYANGRLVTILSSDLIYGKDTWAGFTTGECILTIEGVEYNASAMNLAVTKIGQDAVVSEDQINPAFVENKFEDPLAPVITVEAPEICPNAICNMPYRLFPAAVTDDYSKTLHIDTAVYYNYGTDKQVQVDVVDRCFTPFRAGTYSIVYSCADVSGNVGTSVITVEADDADAKQLQLSLGQLSKGTAGQVYTLAVPEFSSNRGQTGWTAVAKHENGTVEYEISSNDPSFFPEYAGSYEVIYSYNDYVCSGTESRTLVIEKNDKPVFMEEPVLPQYILRGCIYEFPKIDARVYSDGAPVAATPQIYVVEDGNTEVLADYRYVIYAKETVQIIYRMENNGQMTQYASAQIPVLDVGYNGTYRIDKYFVCEDMETEASGKYIRFRPAQDSEKPGRATFANALQMFNFSLRMAATNTGFEKINLYLTDYANSDVVIKMTYRYAKGAVYFSINDQEEYRLASTAFNDKDLPLALNVQKNGTLVMPTGVSSVFYEVTTDMNGAAFEGFTDHKAYFTLEIDGVSDRKRTGVDVLNLSNQIISGIYVDNVKPALSASSAVGERPALSQYVIEPVYFADVLDPSSSCVMYVVAPDGSYAVSVDGVTLDQTAQPGMQHTLRFEQLGDYTVNYLVRDIAGNELTYSYVLKSVDTTPPVIEIMDPVTKGKVNTAIAIADIKVSDGFQTPEEAFVVYASVITPQDQTYAMLDADGKVADSFTVSSAGVYTVQYMVIGPSGNLAIASYEVEVQ